MENETILYLIRHGQTYFNRSQRVQGWADTPLTPEGALAISALGRGLREIPFKAAFASDAGRARQTAELILAERQDNKLPLVIEPAIREWSFGSWEGELESKWWQVLSATSSYATVEEFRQHTFTFKEIASAIKQVDTEGWTEDYKTIVDRTMVGFTEMAERVSQSGGGNLFAVSHGLTISHFLNLIDPQQKMQGLANGSVSKIRYHQGNFEIIDTNDLSYLQKGN